MKVANRMLLQLSYDAKHIMIQNTAKSWKVSLPCSSAFQYLREDREMMQIALSNAFFTMNHLTNKEKANNNHDFGEKKF